VRRTGLETRDEKRTMMRVNKIEKFEDLIAWQKARALSTAIYEISRQGSFAKDFGLAGKVQRASVSIMSNIAEGFERSGLKEFHKFLCMAKASCAEVRSHLYVALDIDYMSESTFKKLNLQAQEVVRIVGGLRVSIANKIKSTAKQR
jgi:four helix bundle protein